MIGIFGGTKFQGKHHAEQWGLRQYKLIYDVRDVLEQKFDAIYLVGNYWLSRHYEEVKACAHSRGIKLEARHE